jgi:hypothetical protein
VSWADFAPRAVDLDLLADYAAGVLEPQAATEVAHLISTEPAWARAHAALARADAAVRVDLRAHAQSRPEPMPADVVARVDDALRVAAGPTNVVPITAARGRARHSSTRQRRFATALAAAAAAAVAVIGGLAVVQNLDGVVSTGEPATAFDSGAESGRGADAGGAVAPTSAPQVPPAFPGGPVVLSTGTNYQLDTLASSSLRRLDLILAVPAPRPSAQAPKSAEDPVAPALLGDASALERLNNVATLQECLMAIAARHPGQALVVDYASFEGQPALVVLVAAPTELSSGRPGVPGTVVVVGLSCGVSGADVRAAVPTS